MKLYGYWRSLATFRVRIAMGLKNIDCEQEYIDLAAGEQFGAQFKSINPQMTVPALVTENNVIAQSMAILEYLNDKFPEPNLLPEDAEGRARVRQISQIAIADAHPLITPRIRNYLEHELKLPEEKIMKWIQHWMNLANEAIEAILTSSKTRKFCHGDQITIADLCVVPQVIGSQFFNCDMSNMPKLMTIFNTCMEMDAFKNAHPQNQPDFPAG